MPEQNEITCSKGLEGQSMNKDKLDYTRQRVLEEIDKRVAEYESSLKK